MKLSVLTTDFNQKHCMKQIYWKTIKKTFIYLCENTILQM